ncbi:unnamed protein product [Blepharisma stoltei]|uniref:Uncharacterized protein n=1 Tax=Blepharisma stoltei TaxID=1481888 RepID=A0AAU9IVQ9_9CILI|nr:unnamed protein product [Blepharisma stoltei]
MASIKAQRTYYVSNRTSFPKTQQNSPQKTRNSPIPASYKHTTPRPPSRSPQCVGRVINHVRYLTPDNYESILNKLPSIKKSQISYITQTIEKSRKSSQNSPSPVRQFSIENSRSPERKSTILSDYNWPKRAEKPSNLVRADLRKGSFSKKQIIGMKENTINEQAKIDLDRYSGFGNRFDYWDEVNNDLSTQESPNSTVYYCRNRLKTLSMAFKLDKTEFQKQLKRQSRRTISENVHLLQNEKQEGLPFERFVQDLDHIANLDDSLYDISLKKRNFLNKW